MDNTFNNKSSLINKRKIILLFSKYFKLITILLLLFLFISSYYFLISPKYKKMKNTSIVLANSKIEELQKLEIYLGRLKSFNESIKNVSDSDKARIEKIISNNNDYEDLIVMIDDIVRNRNLVLESVKIDSDGKKAVSKRTKIVEDVRDLPENIAQIDFSISVSGVNYKSSKDLIADFEKNLRIMDIKSVSFSEGANLDLEISAYYFIE